MLDNMTGAMNWGKVLFTIFTISLFTGCAGADVMILDPSRTFSPTENVVLLLEEPNVEYEMIGIIEAKGSQYNNQSQVVRAARKEAGKIGAQYIFPMATETKEVAAQTLANPVAGGAPIHIAGGTQMTIKFAAIRYLK